MALVLSFDTLQSALEQQSQLLKRFGFTVCSASQKDEALRLAELDPPRVIVFGPHVPTSLRTVMSRRLRASSPSPRLIYMYRETTESTELADAILNAQSDPQTLADTIHFLLGRDSFAGASHPSIA